MKPHSRPQRAVADPAAAPTTLQRIALVTEELPGCGAGGIGGAFHELAVALAGAGHAVDLLFLPPPHAAQAPIDALRPVYAARGVGLVPVPVERHTWTPHSAEGRAYAVFQHLRALEQPYDVVHFHDYKGLGFYALAAKQQTLAFAATTLVVQLHGPSRWALEANGHPFSHEDQLKIDFMERQSISRADILVSPSRYMLGWLRDHGWQMPPDGRVHVIQNVCTDLRRALGGLAPVPARVERFDEIVFFGRHEERKGVVAFCDALDRLAPELAERGVRVTFLGGLGHVNGEPSALYLAGRSRDWRFPLAVLPDLDRAGAARHLTGNRQSVVVVASPVENSPYAVLEAVVLGKPLLASRAGGGGELLDRASAAAMTCDVSGAGLAERLRQVLARGLRTPVLAVAPEATERQWLALHAQRFGTPVPGVAEGAPPKVVVGITHHERPHKLHDAILSIAAQSYPNIEIVVVDDGSRSEATLACLERLQPLLDKLGVRLLRQENKYLGAARNHVARATQSDYLLFLDDDDIALPGMVQTLVTAAGATGAGMVQCLHHVMEEHRRPEAHPFPENFPQKVNYLPLGGPLSLAPLQNCFGAATSLIRRDTFERLGGYTEMFGVGHEDYEFSVRAVQEGVHIELCPLPLYCAETGRPSMISRTSRLRNFARVARAIDPARNPEAWADLFSLNAGRRAAEHDENHRAYTLQTTPQADLVARVTAEPSGSADYALLLHEYAQALGAASFAQAMLALARRRAAAADAPGGSLRVGPVTAPALSATAAPPDPNLIAARVDLAFGRTAEAVAAFCLSLARASLLSAQHVTFVGDLSAHTQGTPDVLRPALRALQAASAGAAQLAHLAPALLRLSLRVGDMAQAQAVLERVMAIDEEHYLAEHPDVARAVAAGAFASALAHFEHTGAREGRAGFTTLTRVAHALRQEAGGEVALGRLRAHLMAGAGGTARADRLAA